MANFRNSFCSGCFYDLQGRRVCDLCGVDSMPWLGEVIDIPQDTRSYDFQPRGHIPPPPSLEFTQPSSRQPLLVQDVIDQHPRTMMLNYMAQASLPQPQQQERHRSPYSHQNLAVSTHANFTGQYQQRRDTNVMSAQTPAAEDLSMDERMSATASPAVQTQQPLAPASAGVAHLPSSSISHSNRETAGDRIAVTRGRPLGRTRGIRMRRNIEPAIASAADLQTESLIATSNNSRQPRQTLTPTQRQSDTVLTLPAPASQADRRRRRRQRNRGRGRARRNRGGSRSDREDRNPPFPQPVYPFPFRSSFAAPHVVRADQWQENDLPAEALSPRSHLPPQEEVPQYEPHGAVIDEQAPTNEAQEAFRVEERSCPFSFVTTYRPGHSTSRRGGRALGRRY